MIPVSPSSHQKTQDRSIDDSEDDFLHTSISGVKISRSAHLLGGENIVLKGGGITIGAGATIRGDLSSPCNIVVGRGVKIGHNVVIKPPFTITYTTTPDTPNTQPQIEKTPAQLQIGSGTVIERNCAINSPKWIGLNVHIGEDSVLNPGVTVHDNVIILPGSLVPDGMVLAPNSTWEGKPVRLLDIS